MLVTAINVGGSAFTAPDGTAYIADANFTDAGGGTFTNGAVLTGNAEAAVYQSSRYGPFVYSIPVSNGTYNVTFKLAEIWIDPMAVGARVFTLTVEGTTTSAIDIVSLAGGQYLPYDLTVPITVADGAINITTTATADQSTLNGIVVRTR